jgi:hypothetical protein
MRYFAGDGMHATLRLLTLLASIHLLNVEGWAEDLGIVRVVTHATPDKPSGHFTATHVGNGLLLTCGHCCRYAGGPQTRVDVRILAMEERTPFRTETGTILCLDQAADIGFIRFDRVDALSTAYALAPQDYPLMVGLPVLQYTWKVPGGDRLYSVHSTVSAVNMFLGPANIQTLRAPVQGDSGAPLVGRADGCIIGVTTGADPWNRFGVHAGIATVYELAARCQLELPARPATPRVIPAALKSVRP